jgi:hypothetical protein
VDIPPPNIATSLKQKLSDGQLSLEERRALSQEIDQIELHGEWIMKPVNSVPEEKSGSGDMFVSLYDHQIPDLNQTVFVRNGELYLSRGSSEGPGGDSVYKIDQPGVEGGILPDAFRSLDMSTFKPNISSLYVSDDKTYAQLEGKVTVGGEELPVQIVARGPEVHVYGGDMSWYRQATLTEIGAAHDALRDEQSPGIGTLKSLLISALPAD